MRKKALKQVLATILTAALAVGLTACSAPAATTSTGSDPADAAAQTADEPAEGGTVYKVGICNYVDDASLNQIVDNIRAGLEEAAAENNVTFEIDYENCNADANVLSQIIANFINDGDDIMIGVATPVAMAMQGATEDNQIPVVFAAVSDPLATGLVDSFEAPGSNITGTSDKLNTESIMKLMMTLNPDIKKVGLLYDIGQDASTTAIAEAKTFLEAEGIEVIERSGTTVDEVVLAAQALVNDQVEAVFTPTDNTVMTAELSIYELFQEAKIPHYCGADSFALNGAFLGYGVNYADLGRKTAEMTADMLINSKDPASTPVETFDNGIATINTETCEALGLSFDEVSTLFAPLCSEVKSIETAESFE